MQKSSPYKSNAVDLTSAKSEASRFGFAKGQSAVEFAMVIAIFLLLVFAVIDYGWVYFAQLNIQQAVDDGGRFASTGNHTTVSVAGKPTTLSRIASIEAYIQNEISIPNVTVAGNLKVCDVTTNTCGTDGVAGNPEDTVTMTLTANVPVTSMTMLYPILHPFTLFPGGFYTFSSSTTFKNEPFDPSETD
ncbi:TadE/TadG family type IV pilus assembly protein [Candidatus Binatus sp.]|uniref:TadE/TadG family type IV pilus assembly protein n=1 Tax=Candidatus Binatus sp. TaxID=2811406 RepID=UPI003C3AFAFD